MSRPAGEHLGRRHLDPRHQAGDWHHDRGSHTAPARDLTHPDVNGRPLGRAAHEEQT